jgi:hypothetical protein
VKSFIGGACFVQRVGELDCNDPLPPPPVPPDGDNPHHFYVAGDTGLASASLEFTSETGAIFVRVYGRNNGAPLPGITATITQNGSPIVLDKVVESAVGQADTSFCAAFGGFIAPNVSATLTFSLTGSAGRAWVRVGDFGELPANWASDALYWENLSGNGSTDDYYCEIQPSQPPGALMLSVVGWLDAGAHTITGTGDYAQFVDSEGIGAAGAACYFGEIDSPGGEPGWGGYVWYSANGVARRPNAVLIAIPGATLPGATP